MVPDIMHIILEGSLELCMHHLLIYLVREKKLFSLDQLNDHTTGITYGLSEVKNKPTEIAPASLTSDGHLKQSGIHMYIHVLSTCMVILLCCWLQLLKCGVLDAFYLYLLDTMSLRVIVSGKTSCCS